MKTVILMLVMAFATSVSAQIIRDTPAEASTSPRYQNYYGRGNSNPSSNRTVTEGGRGTNYAGNESANYPGRYSTTNLCPSEGLCAGVKIGTKCKTEDETLGSCRLLPRTQGTECFCSEDVVPSI